MIKKFLKKLGSNIDIIVALISLVVGVVSIGFAVKWNSGINNSLSELSQNATQLSQNNIELGNTVQVISKNIENLPTKSVKSYPGNIDDILKDIFAYCDNNPEVREIKIYTDFVGYGLLTDNIKWNNYWGKLKSIVETYKKINVYLYFYDKNLRNEFVDKQFSYYSYSQIELNEFLKQCKNNIEENNMNCRHEKRILESITNSTDIDAVKENLIELLNIKEDNLKSLRDNNNNLTYYPIRNTFPYHAWFVFEKVGTGGNTVPVRGIITFPTYQGKNTERGIFTSNKEMLDVFYQIIDDNVKRR